MSLDRVIYSTTAVATGGRNGSVQIQDGLALDLDAPPEMGGNGVGANPEQLFAAGYSACFASALELIAKQKSIAVDRVTVIASVSIGSEGTGYGLAVELTVDVEGVASDVAHELIHTAHAICPYSRAISGNVDVALRQFKQES